jgi:hypothetical protein
MGITGGCYCGGVRYEAHGEPMTHALFHLKRRKSDRAMNSAQNKQTINSGLEASDLAHQTCGALKRVLMIALLYTRSVSMN